MEPDRIRRQTITIFLFCFAYLLSCLPMAALGVVHAFMAWNLFLAMLPLLFILAAEFFFKKKKPWGWGAFALLWLLFFPNAPYMVTDLAHLSRFSFFVKDNIYVAFACTTDIRLWLRMAHIALGILLGVLAGMVSMKRAHRLVGKKWGAGWGWTAVAVTCLLSGYAIYIGRFLRINSWDVLHPFSLLEQMVSNCNLFTLLFTLLFAGCTALCYLLYDGLMGPGREEPRFRRD